jgi:hypothetical protein
MIKRTAFLTILLLGLATLAHAQRPNFNGTWRLDDRASSALSGDGLEGLGNPAPPMLYITHRDNGPMTLSSRLPGAEPRVYLVGGDSWVPAPRPSTGKFLVSSRYRRLSVVSEGAGEVEGEMVSVREVLTLYPSVGSITLEVTTTRSWGPESTKLVYNRVGGGAPSRR